MMVSSVQDVTVRAVESHAQLPLCDWVLKWPSQVVLTVAQIVWTSQVERAIADGTLEVIYDFADGYFYFILTSQMASLGGKFRPRR